MCVGGWGSFVINTAEPTARRRLVYSAVSDLGERRPPAAARDSRKVEADATSAAVCRRCDSRRSRAAGGLNDD